MAEAGITKIDAPEGTEVTITDKDTGESETFEGTTEFDEPRDIGGDDEDSERSSRYTGSDQYQIDPKTGKTVEIGEDITRKEYERRKKVAEDKGQGYGLYIDEKGNVKEKETVKVPEETEEAAKEGRSVYIARSGDEAVAVPGAKGVQEGGAFGESNVPREPTPENVREGIGRAFYETTGRTAYVSEPREPVEDTDMTPQEKAITEIPQGLDLSPTLPEQVAQVPKEYGEMGMSFVSGDADKIEKETREAAESVQEVGHEVMIHGRKMGESVGEGLEKSGAYAIYPDFYKNYLKSSAEGAATLGTQVGGLFIAGAGSFQELGLDLTQKPKETAEGFGEGLAGYGGLMAKEIAEKPGEFVFEEAGEEFGEAAIGFVVAGVGGAVLGAAPNIEVEPEPEVEAEPDVEIEQGASLRRFDSMTTRTEPEVEQENLINRFDAMETEISPEGEVEKGQALNFIDPESIDTGEKGIVGGREITRKGRVTGVKSDSEVEFVEEEPWLTGTVTDPETGEQEMFVGRVGAKGTAEGGEATGTVSVQGLPIEFEGAEVETGEPFKRVLDFETEGETEFEETLTEIQSEEGTFLTERSKSQVSGRVGEQEFESKTERLAAIQSNLGERFISRSQTFGVEGEVEKSGFIINEDSLGPQVEKTVDLTPGDEEIEPEFTKEQAEDLIDLGRDIFEKPEGEMEPEPDIESGESGFKIESEQDVETGEIDTGESEAAFEKAIREEFKARREPGIEGEIQPDIGPMSIEKAGMGVETRDKGEQEFEDFQRDRERELPEQTPFIDVDLDLTPEQDEKQEPGFESKLEPDLDTTPEQEQELPMFEFEPEFEPEPEPEPEPTPFMPDLESKGFFGEVEEESEEKEEDFIDWKPSFAALSEDIRTEEEPETATGLGIRPIVDDEELL